MASEAKYLGPFIGYTTETSTKIWMAYTDLETDVPPLFLAIYLAESNELIASKILEFQKHKLNSAVVSIEGLRQDHTYSYRFFQDEALSTPFTFPDLDSKYFQFRTMPDQVQRIDFMLMSCHHPFKVANSEQNGFAVWRTMPSILDENPEIRFAILAGDQVYADDVVKEALREPDPLQRSTLYLKQYARFWDHPHYRRILCQIPTVLMWDDHEICDGWGTEESSFVPGSSQFKENWLQMFGTARTFFEHYQASRNPVPLKSDSFDFCFSIGRCGFVVPDLRTNRNARKNQIWSNEQFESIKAWIAQNGAELDVVFFVSSVVFTHGDPWWESTTVAFMPLIMRGVSLLSKWLSRESIRNWFDDEVGDLRDDIHDSWSSEVNSANADQVLEYLFDLQNGKVIPGKFIPVVILSGDIHAAGYSTIYSRNPAHEKTGVIPHIVSTPVSYKPFGWALEAIYRSRSKTVEIGNRKKFYAQISHHFCHRNLCVLSIRPQNGPSEHEFLLKVKFYLEGFAEPQILLFDLVKSSHRESIEWS